MSIVAALRGAYGAGLLAPFVASALANSASAPQWFTQAIHEACLLVAVVIAALWLGSEVVARLVSSRVLIISLVSAAFFGTVASSIYLLSAAMYGESTAELSTWHLISVFAVMHHVVAAAIGAGLALSAAIFYAGAAFVWRAGRASQ